MKPSECASIDDVRANIDRLDREIVALLAERGGFVQRAAAFKKTKEDVKAPARVAQVISKVRALAAAAGTDPDRIEAIYRTIIEGAIRAELDEHTRRENAAGSLGDGTGS